MCQDFLFEYLEVKRQLCIATFSVIVSVLYGGGNQAQLLYQYQYRRRNWATYRICIVSDGQLKQICW